MTHKKDPATTNNQTTTKRSNEFKRNNLLTNNIIHTNNTTIIINTIMNALRSASLIKTSFHRAIVAQQARTKATMSAASGSSTNATLNATNATVNNQIKKGVANPQMHYQNNNKNGFKAAWLSDPSTYPIMVIISCAITFMVGMGFHALFFYKDVQISPEKRGSVLQTWGHEKHVGVMEHFANAVGRPKAEGLGIDHDEWQSRKDDYMNNKGGDRT
mmetsp:Transcript_20444/g.58114  ORF Transcript_20444/g.58114 Transcript_20444/m.58114 type:complete len:216 (+) Transcript_20444:107-754(+)